MQFHIVEDSVISNQNLNVIEDFDEDQSESHLDLSDKAIQLNLAQNMITEILRAAKMRGLEEADKIQRI